MRLSFQEYRPLEQKVFYGDTESKIQVIQTDRAKANEKNVKVSDYQTFKPTKKEEIEKRTKSQGRYDAPEKMHPNPVVGA